MNKKIPMRQCVGCGEMKNKRLYADAMLDNAGLKELVAKKW